MTKVIWKKQLDVVREQVIELPKYSEILHVAEQGGQPTIWFLFVREEKETANRKIKIYGTNSDIPLKEKYLGTCQCMDLVWHVFEEKI